MISILHPFESNGRKVHLHFMEILSSGNCFFTHQPTLICTKLLTVGVLLLLPNFKLKRQIFWIAFEVTKSLPLPNFFSKYLAFHVRIINFMYRDESLFDGLGWSPFEHVVRSTSFVVCAWKAIECHESFGKGSEKVSILTYLIIWHLQMVVVRLWTLSTYRWHKSFLLLPWALQLHDWQRL
jgi:hypothetical protein